ncbi:splicing factor 3B subunit 1-like isoform X5 [Neoarius graeffei]|uniref:splicing factor 3B subunit 1-like isoform X5 n=1 Tax=Neoarius graeffei TaxID=443677 RepID=UPI00298BEA5D|nr:splicing factor 3B subunit 1-like isoform X5 [Neoarius graeffei]XP_060785653.1 splicing factor 3B subunit 1-like isoform X5 [Neoarius graeffei]
MRSVPTKRNMRCGKKITDAVNSVNPAAVRDVSAVQKRFKNMVPEAKKEIYKRKTEPPTGGGKAKKLKVTTEMVIEIYGDIEAQILEIQGMKAVLLEEGAQGVGLDSTGYYDQEIYGGSDSRFAGYVTSIAANEQEDDDEEDSSTTLLGQKKPGYHAPVAILNSIPQSDEQYDPFAEHRPQKISDREDEYKRRRQKMIISPERHDPFADGFFSAG